MVEKTGAHDTAPRDVAPGSRPSSGGAPQAGVQDRVDRPSHEIGELERVRAHMAAIVDSSEDGIISKTLDGIVTSWNQGAERLFGYTAQEMIGQPITRLIPPELQHEEIDILAKIRRGERIDRYEALRIHKQGHPLNISLTISPVRDAAGRIVGAAKIAHDVTANRQAQAAFQEEVHALEILHRVGQSVAE